MRDGGYYGYVEGAPWLPNLWGNILACRYDDDFSIYNMSIFEHS